MSITATVMSAPKRAKPSSKVGPKAGRSAKVSSEFRDLISAGNLELIQYTKRGIGSVVVSDLAVKLHIPVREFSGMIGLSSATWSRKIRTKQRLSLHMSERTVRYANLWKQALELWGTEAAAQEWLNAPEQALGGETPLVYAETEMGSRRVEDLIGQLAYGIAT